MDGSTGGGSRPMIPPTPQGGGLQQGGGMSIGREGGLRQGSGMDMGREGRAGGGAPPIYPGPMPVPQPPIPQGGQGGFVDAGYGNPGSPLINGMQWQGPGGPPPLGGALPPSFIPTTPIEMPPAQPPTSQKPAPAMGPPQVVKPTPVAQPPSATGQQNQVKVHNPTGIGVNNASQMAAAKRPNPSTNPKQQGPMGPPVPQKAGTGKY